MDAWSTYISTYKVTVKRAHRDGDHSCSIYRALPGQGVGRGGGPGRELHLADERAFATLLRDLESPVEHDVEAVAGLALGADCRTGRHLVKAQRAAELQPRLAAQRAEAAAARVE